MHLWLLIALAIVLEIQIIRMATKVSELEAKFTALADETDKIATEVQNLKDALANTEIPEAAQAALDRLTASLKKVDDLNVDQPPPTT